MSGSTSDDDQDLELTATDRIAGVMFDHLRSIVEKLRADHSNKRIVRREACAATLLAVNAVDVFLNMLTGLTVCARPDAFVHQPVLSDFHMGIQLKLRTWPQVVCGRALGESDPRWIAFEEARVRRNSIVHFGWREDGHPIYDTLDLQAAEDALGAAEGIVCLILEAAGETAATMAGALHHWIGKVPSLEPAA